MVASSTSSASSSLGLGSENMALGFVPATAGLPGLSPTAKGGLNIGPSKARTGNPRMSPVKASTTTALAGSALGSSPPSPPPGQGGGGGGGGGGWWGKKWWGSDGWPEGGKSIVVALIIITCSYAYLARDGEVAGSIMPWSVEVRIAYPQKV